MATAGEIAVVLIVLALIAGGSTVAWVYLFRAAAKVEEANPPSPLNYSRAGEKG
ncbi:MAG: hypothetical protein ACREOL_08785 [Candidatus Dormibacteria bacterium]